MERALRSLQLVSQSYRVLMRDKELMVLPVVSGAVMSVVIAMFVLLSGLNASTVQVRGPELYVPAFFLYVALYAVGIFFQCAVVAGATERLRGGDPTLGSALGAAARRIVAILIWAILAATIGIVLRSIQERVGLIGKIVVAMIGAAWSLATFFVVPVLVLEDVYIGDVLGRSVGLFKETWGENFVGGVSLGFAAFCAWAALGVISFVLFRLVGPPALLVLGLGAVGLIMFFSTLQGVFLASLYHYATEGAVAPGFDKSLMASAFIEKR